jgi:hypothetical protein
MPYGNGHAGSVSFPPVEPTEQEYMPRVSIGSRIHMTPVLSSIEAALRRAAVSGDEMPDNSALCDISGACRSTVARAVVRLHAAGRLRYEVERRRRRVVFADGAATGWRRQHVGHASYTSTERTKPVKGAATVEEPTATVVVRPAPVLSEPLPPRQLRGSKTCVWPMWGDDERATGIYCDEPTMPGCSYCQIHGAVGKYQRITQKALQHVQA